MPPYNEDNMTPDQRNSDTLRNSAEDFRKVPQPSEAFRTVPNDAEVRESHTLTVREVARMFEDAGVARTERSVTNWCRKDAAGSSRLHCRYDQNERKYFITPESAERAIQEELAKGGVTKGAVQPRRVPQPAAAEAEDHARVEELELKLRDAEIATRAKDQFIKQLQEDRTNFVKERQALVDRLADSSRQVGKLEARLHLLEAGGSNAKKEATN